MTTFDVRFMKTIPDDTGHDHTVCQWQLRIDTPTEAEAIQRAQAAFCRERRIHHWMTHADAIESQAVAPETSTTPAAAMHEADIATSPQPAARWRRSVRFG